MIEPRLKHDKFYIFGAIVVIAGYLISLNPYWWIFGTPLLYIVGITFVLLSKATRKTKILFIIMPIACWFPGFLALIYFGNAHATPQTFLIPQNFRGEIILYYGEPCGQELKKEDGRYIYLIPQNGLMIIRNPIEYGIINQEYYFINAKKQKISKLDVVDQSTFNEAYALEKNKQEPPRNRIAIFLNGGSIVQGTGSKKYVFEEFYVGSYNNLRTEKVEKADSVGVAFLKNCRK